METLLITVYLGFIYFLIARRKVLALHTYYYHCYATLVTSHTYGRDLRIHMLFHNFQRFLIFNKSVFFSHIPLIFKAIFGALKMEIYKMVD